MSYEEYDTMRTNQRDARDLQIAYWPTVYVREKPPPDGPIRYKPDVITAEHSQTPSLPVRGLPDAPAEQGKQAGTRYPAETVQWYLIPDQSSSSTSRDSVTSAGLSTDTTAASSNHTSDSVSQSANQGGIIHHGAGRSLRPC